MIINSLSVQENFGLGGGEGEIYVSTDSQLSHHCLMYIIEIAQAQACNSAYECTSLQLQLILNIMNMSAI